MSKDQLQSKEILVPPTPPEAWVLDEDVWTNYYRELAEYKEALNSSEDRSVEPEPDWDNTPGLTLPDYPDDTYFTKEKFFDMLPLWLFLAASLALVVVYGIWLENRIF